MCGDVMYREFELGTRRAQPKVNERLRRRRGEQDVIVRHALRVPTLSGLAEDDPLESFRHEDGVAQGGPEEKEPKDIRGAEHFGGEDERGVRKRVPDVRGDVENRRRDEMIGRTRRTKGDPYDGGFARPEQSTPPRVRRERLGVNEPFADDANTSRIDAMSTYVQNAINGMYISGALISFFGGLYAVPPATVSGKRTQDPLCKNGHKIKRNL